MVKHTVKVVCIFALLFLFIVPTWAQEKYPDRPIDLICTWGVGGGADQMARIISRLTEPILGVPIPVSNVPGASGNAGLANLLAAKADGYTLAVYIADTLATVSSGISRYKLTDFDWVVRLQLAPSFLFVKYDSQFKTIQDLLAYAKENPEKLKVGATGFGSVDDLTIRYLASKGYKMTLLPVPKPGERYASVLGGHSDVLYEQAGDVRQYLEAKQIRPLIIFLEKRLPTFPDIPCSVELGYELTFPQFRGLVSRAGTPKDRIKILADAFKKATETAEWQKFAEEQILDPESFMGPEEFTKWVTEQMESMRDFMKTFGMVK